MYVREVNYHVLSKRKYSFAYDNNIHPSVKGVVAESKQIFSDGNISILSNSVGTLDDFDNSGAIATEKAMGIPVIIHSKKKPDCLQEVGAHDAN
jgi:hypothetical protein